MPEAAFVDASQPVEPKPTDWPKIILAAALGLALLAGAAYASYLVHQYYQFRCSSAKSFSECIEKGCIFVDVGLSNDPQVRSSP